MFVFGDNSELAMLQIVTSCSNTKVHLHGLESIAARLDSQVGKMPASEQNVSVSDLIRHRERSSSAVSGFKSRSAG